MINPVKYLRRFWRQIRTQLWFTPSVIALGFFLLSMLFISLRYIPVAQALDEKLRFLALANEDTARSILSTLTGGLISLVVFSFSMVMVVLNQATAQFSPRLLPGLISKQQHQRILGFYLGAIIYNLTVLARIGPKEQVPVIAVILAIVFGLLSLGLFISFIHAISNSVRIDTILQDLHQRTSESLRTNHARIMKSRQADEKPPKDIADWTSLQSQKSGYLLGVEADTLLSIAGKEGVSISVQLYQGEFVLQDQVVLKISGKVSEEAVESLLAALRIDVNESIEEDYLHGLNQLVEIAVKAMSPGINDPATASSALDFLTALLEQYLQQHEPNCLLGEEKETRLWLQPRPLREVIFALFAPLRAYATQDVVVTRKLLRSLLHLSHLSGLSKDQREILRQELEKTKTDALVQLRNEQDQLLVKNF